MAAPHVAGAFALLRSKRSECSPFNILEALKSSGVAIDDDRKQGVIVTTPRIDVRAALDALGGCEPEAPRFVSAQTSGEREIRVSWTDVSPNEDSHEILIRNAQGGIVRVDTVPANDTNDARTEHVIRLLLPGRTYSFAVRACRNGACSPYVDAPDNAKTTPHPLPSRPMDLRTVSVGAQHIEIAWTPATGGTPPTTYSVALIGQRTRRVLLPIMQTSMRWEGLLPDELYNISMGACDAHGCSTGTYLSVRTDAIGDAPSDLRVVARTPSTVELAWTNSAIGVTHHEVEVTRSTGYGLVRDIQVIPSATPSATISLTVAEFSQSFRVRGCDSQGCTAYSRTAH